MAQDLKSQLTLLKSFQDIDVVLQKIESELRDLPNKIAEARLDLTDAEDLINEKNAEKTAIEKARKNKETELEDKETHLKEREAKLFAIKTNKEYQAALKEIADGRDTCKQMEEELISMMEKIDKLSQETTQLSSGLADTENAFKEREAVILAREEELKKEKEKDADVVKETEAKIDKSLLRQYRLVQTRYTDALAIVGRGICMGCNKRIPPQTYIELQKWSDVIECPHCHRILVVEEEKEPEEN